MLLMGVPLLLLPLAARGFRPRGIAVALRGRGAFMWQALPAVAGWRTATESRAQDESFWYPVIAWLAEHPEPDHRVQVVATADNWEAYYLARRDVPLARGWFRQDDFPANAVLYGPLTARSYESWLRRTGVHYVFLPDDPLDYSASNEAELLRSGESGLREVAQVGGWTVFELPRPTPDRDAGRRHLGGLAHLRRRHAARGAAGHLPAAAALHALLERGAGLRVRRAARALGHRPAGHEPRDRAPVLRRAPRHLRRRGAGQPGRLRLAGVRAPRAAVPPPVPR